MTTQPPDFTFKDSQARHDVLVAAKTLRGLLANSKGRSHRDAWAVIETYLAVSFRVMDQTQLEDIKDSAITEEIKARLHGRHVA